MRGKSTQSIRFLHLYFLALIGQHDCVTLLNGDTAVYPCVCRDESMAVFILIAVSEPTVINVIISVSAAITAVFIIIVITDVIAIIFVILFTAAAAIISKIIFNNVIILAVIINNISPRYRTLAVVTISIAVLHTNFISRRPMKGVILEVLMSDEIMCYLWSGTPLRQ